MHLLTNGCEHFTLVGIRAYSNGQVKVATKNKNTNFFACELWVKRVCTFYRNQWPINFILHFAKLHIDSSIRYQNSLIKILFKYIFSNVIKSKEI